MVSAGQGPLAIVLLAGLTVLLILLPVGILVGVWYGMGFSLGIQFVLFFVPVFSRLFFASTESSILAAIAQGLLFFLAFFIGITIVTILERFFAGTAVYAQHLQLIWPGYDAAAKMFFSVCTFALVNQLLEFRHAYRLLFR